MASADVKPTDRSLSPLRRRLRKFRRIKRGYYAFWVIAAAYALSFLAPLFINDQALAVKRGGQYCFPLLRYCSAQELGQEGFGAPRYRALQAAYAAEGKGDWVIMPPYPYSPTESLLDLSGTPPHQPVWPHIMGTDDRGRDVFTRLAYGFNVSLTFAILVLVFGEGFGILVGALLGYFGGKLDMLGVRVIEIWSSLPFLYTIIIISSIVVPVYVPGRNLTLQPAFWLLIGIVVLFNWMGITYYVRGEFYREKSKDYVAAAIAMGLSDTAIIFRHILPNAVTPVISFAPFTLVANVVALVALDFLGFGLPAPTPSWGELIGQGMTHLTQWWLVVFPLGAMFVTLLLIVFVGEAVREAFDPKEFSRLR